MDPKLLVIALAVVMLLGTILRYKRSIALPLTFAFFISLIWTSYYRYEYVGDNIFLFDQINIYPLVLWTVGLTILYVAYGRILKRYSWLVTICIYIVSLLAFEGVGYYLLGIRLASNYPDLLDLGVIHAPKHVQLFYVTAGPLYLAMLEYGLHRLIPNQQRLR